MSQAQTYQCPNCNGVMSWDATIGKLRCFHCGHVFEEGEAKKTTIPIGTTPVEKQETTHAKTVEDFLERAPWEVTSDGSVNAVSYSCPSCAAEIVADQSVVSTMCPYCGNNMLVSGTATAENIPQWVLPFSVTKEQAEERMREHFQHKWYLSRAFDAQLAHLQGMYIPYHLYDMRVWGHADYLGYYDVSSDDHDTRYYCAIKRKGYALFERVPVDGSSKMPDGHMDAIAPFGFDEMREFDAGYAAGYLMEVADEDAEQCEPRAEQRVRNSFENDLRADARNENRVEGIEETVTKETNVRVENVSSCVLPVWLMHCTWNDNQMLFAVNGETGKCVGDLPVESKRRVATIATTALALTAAAVILFITMISGSDKELGFIAGAIVFVILITVLVDSHFMSQMHTAVEATNASMSYSSEGLVVTNRWRSKKNTTRKNKARGWLEEQSE